MLNDIYNKRIIELADVFRLGQLAEPDATATAHSKLCGSTVKVDLKMKGPVVTDFAHDVKACALGQASSSIVAASHVVGSTADELRELRETVRKMLKENGSPPEGKWADIALLEPVRDYKARHASTMTSMPWSTRSARSRRRPGSRLRRGMNSRSSFSGGPKDRTAEAQLRIGEHRDPGFDATHRLE